MVQVKICGMKEAANIGDISALKPTYLGFLCWSGSPRFVGDTFALPAKMGEIKRVGVFVNQSEEEITGWVERLSLSVLQLHGDESVDFCKKIKAKFPALEVWKAFSVSEVLPSGIEQYRGVIDRVLFDTKSPGRGGSGSVFSWDVLKRYDVGLPIVLSGGLSAENVADVLQLCKEVPDISVLDFNSRLEVAPGIKDLALVEQVLQTLRA